MLYVGIASLIVAMGVTWCTTPLMIRVARALGTVDHPSQRKVHVEPIPRIGGVAVFLGFFSGLVFAAIATGSIQRTLEQSRLPWIAFALTALGLLLVGLIDDVRGLSFQWKFAAQIAGAVNVWFAGFRIELISHPLGGDLDLGMLSLPLTVLWIVGVTNAVNLIDGLDGLATGIALIITLTVAVIAFMRAQLGVTAVSVTLAGALMGFLRFNFNPARIFLGDSGSLFLGFVLAVTSVRGSQKGATAVAIAVPLLVLGVPLLDTGLAVARRLYRLGDRGMRSGTMTRYVMANFREVFLPDRKHIHHRLMELGLSHRRAVIVLYIVGALFAASAFALVGLKSLWVAGTLLAVLGVLMAGFMILLYSRIWKARSNQPTGDPAADGPRAPERTAWSRSHGG